MGLGTPWLAAGAGFFSGLNTDYQRNYDEQKQFNDQYEQRVQKGIDAFNASQLQASKDVEAAKTWANFIPGDETSYPQRFNMALGVIRSGMDPKLINDPDTWRRMKLNFGQPQGSMGSVNNTPGGQAQPGMNAQPPKPIDPRDQAMQPSQASGASQPSMPLPPSVMPGMAPQGGSGAPTTGPGMVQPPQAQLQPSGPQMAPQGVAQPGLKGTLAHYLTGQPNPGQREGIASTRAGEMHGMSPEQAAAYANFSNNQNPIQMAATPGAQYGQIPDLKTLEGIAKGNNNPQAAIEAIISNNPSSAFATAYTDAQKDQALISAQYARGEATGQASAYMRGIQITAMTALKVLDPASGATDEDRSRAQSILGNLFSYSPQGGFASGGNGPMPVIPGQPGQAPAQVGPKPTQPNGLIAGFATDTQTGKQVPVWKDPKTGKFTPR